MLHLKDLKQGEPMVIESKTTHKPFMMPTWIAVLFHIIVWIILMGLVGYAIWHPETVAVIFPDFKWQEKSEQIKD